MALHDSKLKMVLAVLSTAFAIVAFGAGNVQLFNYELIEYQQQSTWLLVGSLSATYLVSDRDMGELSGFEMAALGVPAVVVVGMKYVTQIDQIVMDNSPISQVILIILALGSVYVLSET